MGQKSLYKITLLSLKYLYHHKESNNNNNKASRLNYETRQDRQKKIIISNNYIYTHTFPFTQPILVGTIIIPSFRTYDDLSMTNINNEQLSLLKIFNYDSSKSLVLSIIM